MNLQQLQTILQGQIDQSGTITIDDATLGTSGVDALITASPLGATSIIVSTTGTLPVPTTTLTVTGTSSLLGQSGSTTTVVFQEGGDGIVFALSAQLAPGWTFNQSFPQLDGTPLAGLTLQGSSLVFTNQRVPGDATTVGLAPGLNYTGTLTGYQNEFTDALAFLGINAPPAAATLQGPLTMSGGALGIDVRTLFDVAASIGPISLSRPYLGARYAAGTPALTTGGTVTVASVPLDLSAAVAGSGALDFALDTRLTLGGLADLVPLLGSSGWQGLVPSQLSALGGFGLRSATAAVAVSGGSASVSSIDVVMGISNPWPIVSNTIVVTGIVATFSTTSTTGPWSIDIVATATIGGAAFTLEIVTQPSLTVTGRLAVDHTYDLPTLVAELLGGGLTVPPDLVTLTLGNVTFEAVPSSSSYTIGATGTAGVHIYGEANLAMENIVVSLTRDTASGTSGSLTATMALGGAAFDIAATIGSGVVFNGSLDAPVQVTAFLSQLTGQTITVPSEVPDFTVEKMALTIDTSKKSVSLSGEIDAQWQIPLANATPSIDVTFSVASSVTNGTRTYTGFVEGGVRIGQTFDVVYTFGDGVSVVKGTWSGGGGGISYGSVGSSLGISTSVVPDPLGMSMPDFGLTSAALVVDFRQPSVTFTGNASMGSAFFEASKANDGTWGFFLGVAASGTFTFGSLPGGLGSALSFFDFASFSDAYLVIGTNTTTLTNAQLPPLGDKSIGVVPGLNIGVSADLTTGSHALGEALNKVSGLDTLFIQGAIATSTSNTYLEATVAGPPLEVPGAGGLSLSSPFVKIHLAPPALTLGGSAIIPWSAGGGTQQVTVTGMFTINDDSADFAVLVTFPALGAPMGFIGVSLQEIGAEIGITFEPPAVELGLEAVFVLGKQTSSDMFAFVFDVTADAINPKLLQVRITEMDLQTMFDVLVPGVELPSALGSGIVFSNFFIYWCDLTTTLPDGSQAQPGFGFNGTINAFDFVEATAAIMINASNGMTGSFSLAPITVNAGGVQVVFVSGAGGGNLTFAFSTISSPYLSWSGAVNLLGIADASSQGQITSGGFAFSTQMSLLGASSSLACTYQGATNFSANGSWSIPNLDLTLGPYQVAGVTVIPRVHITGPTASLGLGIAVNPQVIAQLSVQFSFSWGFDVNVSFTLSLADIANALTNLWSAVVNWLQNNLAKVFAGLLGDMSAWIDAVKNGFLDFAGGVDDIAHVLYNFFGQTVPEELAKALTEVGAAFEDAAKAVAKFCNVALEEAAKILESLADVCAMSTANAQLSPSVHAPALVAARRVMAPMRTSGPLGDSVLFDLKRTVRGRDLLTGYLLHQAELEWLLGKQVNVRAAIRRLDDSSAHEQPIRYALAVLDIVAERGSRQLRAAAAEARPLLEQGTELSYEQFLDELRRG